MDKSYTGSGDPRRSFELLWGRQEPGRRGPKARLSTDAVVEAAIAIADVEGLAGLSMRRVAEAVGVSAMSLYTYVPSKAELVDLLFDRAVGAVEDPGDTIVGWRAKLAFIARERWAMVEKHPWFLDLAAQRPPLGPNVLKKAEVALRVFDGMGLAPQDMQFAAETLQNYIAGALQTAREARDVEAQSGITDDEWFALIGPVLKEFMEPERYPTLVGALPERKQRSRTPDERRASFEFGLERVLDGLEAFIQRSSTAGK